MCREAHSIVDDAVDDSAACFSTPGVGLEDGAHCATAPDCVEDVTAHDLPGNGVVEAEFPNRHPVWLAAAGASWVEDGTNTLFAVQS
jgi:hypothetical protein